jgi:hypothetical protein
LHIGLFENPVFSAPDLSGGTPPGGPGSCLVLKNGASLNASCAEERNFGCEEKKPLPGSTTKKQALETKYAFK